MCYISYKAQPSLIDFPVASLLKGVSSVANWF